MTAQLPGVNSLTDTENLLEARTADLSRLHTRQCETVVSFCYASWLIDSFFLPRARRRASTLRPVFVDIRCRKPWVFFRLRLWGWNVRFMEDTPIGEKKRVAHLRTILAFIAL
jgi:hypothetical protein